MARVRRATRPGSARDREPGTLLPQIALAHDRARVSIRNRPAATQVRTRCPKKTTLKACRTRAANTGVRRACRNLSRNRLAVLMKTFRATASRSLKEIKHDRTQPDVAGISGDCSSIRCGCRDPAAWLGARGLGLPAELFIGILSTRSGGARLFQARLHLAKPAAPRALAAAAI
jgi:hypothetical protein